MMLNSLMVSTWMGMMQPIRFVAAVAVICVAVAAVSLEGFYAYEYDENSHDDV